MDQPSKSPKKSTDSDSDKPANTGTVLKAAGLVSAIGIDIAVCTVAGYYLGSWWDSFGSGSSTGIRTGIGVLIGVVIGMVSVIYLIKKVMEDSDG
ncbi:AtpZ/AtpI family protein [Paenibacillus sp. YPG26]|uniref:AtpZ/AtpI family protein n=1 Tax=Paenibacillus sp. YPG26 TaxID=2878915 RepID=UPI00203D4166|nr:AtpZ/AtpI family protein [Paenibacillus sp. YPG26]USB32889.1 AtpZ/AtpI family protein [Paenibacillus sp. YPG26]